MSNRAAVEKAFRASIQAAEDGARINSRDNDSLVTTFFLITPEPGIQLAMWQKDEHPREDMETVKRIVREHNAVGLVFVAETHLGIKYGDVAGVPAVGMKDGVLVYGYLPGDRNNPPYTSARTFLRNEVGGLLPMQMDIPPIVTDWVKEALA
jgi:hypothetical protein